MAKKDFYQLLGVEKNADEATIKKAYRKLARELHPDANLDDPTATEKFKEVKEAYDVLSDSQKRAMYDQYGHDAFNQDQGIGGGYGSGGYGASGFGDISDIFETFFSGGMGGMGGQQRNGPVKGNDLRVNLNISFEESFFGVEKEIQVNREENCPTCGGSGAKPGTKVETCPVCKGSGQVQTVQRTMLGNMMSVRACSHCGGSGKIITEPCTTCKGSGKVHRRRPVKVKVPAGIEHGRRLRLNGEGEPGDHNGPNGDLYVVIGVQPHKHFSRKADDLVLESRISYTQAVLGGEIKVPTMEGIGTLKIPEGTESGVIFRMKGKGFPSLTGYGKGDMQVQVKVDIPKKLNDKQREALVQFAVAMGDDEAGKGGKGFFDKMKDILK